MPSVAEATWRLGLDAYVETRHVENFRTPWVNIEQEDDWKVGLPGGDVRLAVDLVGRFSIRGVGGLDIRKGEDNDGSRVEIEPLFLVRRQPWLWNMLVGPASGWIWREDRGHQFGVGIHAGLLAKVTSRVEIHLACTQLRWIETEKVLGSTTRRFTIGPTLVF